MRPSELEGKNVVTPEAKIIGAVSGVEIDCLAWKVTHLLVRLADEMINTLGIQETASRPCGNYAFCRCSKGCS